MDSKRLGKIGLCTLAISLIATILGACDGDSAPERAVKGVIQDAKMKAEIEAIDESHDKQMLLAFERYPEIYAQAGAEIKKFSESKYIQCGDDHFSVQEERRFEGPGPKVTQYKDFFIGLRDSKGKDYPYGVRAETRDMADEIYMLNNPTFEYQGSTHILSSATRYWRKGEWTKWEKGGGGLISFRKENGVIKITTGDRSIYTSDYPLDITCEDMSQLIEQGAAAAQLQAKKKPMRAVPFVELRGQLSCGSQLCSFDTSDRSYEVGSPESDEIHKICGNEPCYLRANADENGIVSLESANRIEK